MTRDDLPAAPVPPAFVRPPFLAGVERELALPLLSTCLYLVLTQPPGRAWAVAFLLYAVPFPFLRRLAARDPQTVAVLRSHLLTAGFYRGIAAPGDPRAVSRTF